MVSSPIAQLPERSADLAWSLRPDPSEHKRQVNEHMRHALRRLDPNEQIPFFCECEREDCFRTVWLIGVAYDGRLRSADTARTLISEHCADVASLAV